MEATVNNIFEDEKFNDALDAMLTIAEYSKIYQYKVDICSDIIGHILTYQSLYGNKPLTKEDINKRAQCKHTDEYGNYDRTLRVVKIDDKIWFRCDLCNTLFDMNPPSNFAPVVSRVKKTIYEDVIFPHNAECLEKGIAEPLPEIYSLLFKDATTMYNINVELKRMIRAKHHKTGSKRKSPYNFSKTILE